MKTLASLVILALAPGLAAAQATKDDLKKLAKAGVSEDVILAYIKANGFEGKPSSDDLIEMKDAGLSEKVLAGILAPNADAPAPRAAESRPATSPPSTVYVERPVYPSGSWSVSPVYYSSSYCSPYTRYYSGSWYRPYYGYSSYHHRPSYYGSYYRSHCSPRLSVSFSSGSWHRGGHRSRVRW